jgi:hypothetical protein
MKRKTAKRMVAELSREIAAQFHRAEEMGDLKVGELP